MERICGLDAGSSSPVKTSPGQTGGHIRLYRHNRDPSKRSHASLKLCQFWSRSADRHL